MTGSGSNRGKEFLSIPKAVREARDVTWLGKALVCHLRFRQRDRETVSIGERRLADDLGASINAVSRAVGEAEAKGWLKVLNRHTRKRGERYVYDARPVDDIGSVAESETLSEGGERPRNGDTSVPKPETAKCTTSRDTPVAEPGTRQEEVKKNDTRREKEPEQRLLSLAFPGGSSKKQTAALLKPARDGRAAGVPYPWMAHSLVSGKIDGAPWERIDAAVAKARAMVAEINRQSRKQFRDLQHVIQYARADGDGLPETIRVKGTRYRVAEIIKYATEWPGQTGTDE